MKRILQFLLLFSHSFAFGQTTVFTQNFNSSDLQSYIGATPTIGQFNAIGTSNNDNGSVSIENGKLKYTRNNSPSAGSFSRTASFSPVPEIIIYKLDIEVAGNAVAQTTAATFLVGNGVGTANSVPTNANIHSRFGINLTANDGEFVVRELGTGSVTGTGLYTGNQTITWVINNSTASYSYTPPGGGPDETVAPDTWDLFVGNTKELNDRPATTATQTLANLKFVFDAGVASISLDNILITSVETLPISLTTFTAKPVDKTILLNWKTASEKGNKFFEVQRSADGKAFTTIVTLDGAGDSDLEKNYSFVDENPFAGTNYYKLVQYDFDGKSTSKTISVDSKLEIAQVFVSSTNSSVDLNISSPNHAKATVYLYDLEGGKLAEKSLNLTKGSNSFSFTQSLTPGIYFVSVITEGAKVNAKFAKWQ